MCKQSSIIKRDKCNRMCLYKMLALEEETLSLIWEMETERERERERERESAAESR